MRFSIPSILSLSMLSCLAACSSTSSTPGTPIEQGLQVITAQGCQDCHGSDFSGSATGITKGITKYPTRNTPNLTPDKDTGVGGWTDAQLKTAIRTGIDDEGAELCWVMPRFKDLSDSDVDHVIAYLRSLPPVAKEIPDSECPKATDAGK